MSRISREDALASLARMREALRFIPGAAEARGIQGRSALYWINEWDTRISARDLEPDRLPELYGWVAGAGAASAKLRTEFLEEQRILQTVRQQGAGYGAAVWYGERGKPNPLQQLREDVNRAIDEVGREAGDVIDLDQERRDRR